MAGIKSTAASALLIPRFVHNLNAMAARCGLAVDTGARDPDPSECWDEGRGRLVAIWRGTAKQLRETGVLSPSYHFPLGERGHFRFGWWRRGRVFKDGRGWRMELDCGEIPRRIEKHGEAEVISHEEATMYHGTREALIAANVVLPRTLPVGRCWTQGDLEKRIYQTHRLRDDTYLVQIENKNVFKARIAENQRDTQERRKMGIERHSSSIPGHERETQTADEFRKRCAEAAACFLFSLHKLTGWKAGNVPFRYDDEALNALRESICEIVLTIRDGKIIKLRDTINLDRLEAVKQAESDPRFQRFLVGLNLSQRPAA